MSNSILSTKSSSFAFSLGMLVLRVCIGGVMLIDHGWVKLTHFSEMQDKFMNFLGLGSTISLGLAVFAEFFCALFILVGLFTRLTVIPLIILFLVILTAHFSWHITGPAQLPFILLAGSVAILLMGPGKISIDAAFKK